MHVQPYPMSFTWVRIQSVGTSMYREIKACIGDAHHVQQAIPERLSLQQKLTNLHISILN